MHHHRRGSLLFMLIMMMAVLTVVAFAGIRAVQLGGASARADQRQQLAQAATQAGIDHAIEYILRDYRATSVQVRSGTGLVTISTADGPPPPTRLEGNWRQPFLSHDRPNSCSGVTNDFNASSSWDDVRAEDPVDAPISAFWWCGWDYAGGTPFGRWFYGMDGGYTYYDGRGRFYEPGFYNLPTQLGETVPTVPVRFTDPSPALPTRAEGIWLDDKLRRVDEPDPLIARRIARYRLRYAVGVDDLDGMILANGDAWLNEPRIATADPTDAALTMTGSNGNETNEQRVRRLVRYAPVYFNLTQVNQSTEVALRAEHVFLNRGSSSNCAKDADGFPVSFPLQYRQQQSSNGAAASWEVFKRQTASGNPAPDQLYTYVDVSGNVITPRSIAGGAPLFRNVCDPIRGLVGPQLSFENLRFAVNGRSGSGVEGNVWGMKYGYGRLTTPFGRGLTPNAEVTRYRSPVDVPWNLNLLTAPPRAISAVLTAYIPWRSRTAHFNKVVFTGAVDTDSGGNPFPHDLPGNTAEVQTFTADTYRATPNRDCFNKLFSPAFPYAPPQKDAASPDVDKALVPNWYGPDLRVAADRYPGPLMTPEDPLPVGAAPDDCGKDILAMTTTGAGFNRFPGFCIYTTKHLMDMPSNVSVVPPADPGTLKPVDWNSKVTSSTKDSLGNYIDKYIWSNGTLTLAPDPYQYHDSFFFDMAWAMADAISVMRVQWSQYDRGYVKAWDVATNPAVHFKPLTLWRPQDHRTLADLDRVFLENLGIKIDDPAGTTVVPAWNLVHPEVGWDTSSWYLAKDFNVGYNIRMLRHDDKLVSGTATSLDRSRIMELVLNDYRLSLLGSSPDYAASFTPLDFNGDGVVHCSGYNSNPADLPAPAVRDPAEGAAIDMPVATAKSLRLDQWRPVAAGGAGPSVDVPFSISGNFFIGKSHFYRIISRGELWDNRLQRPVMGVTQDTVINVDPQALGDAGLNATHVLFSRQHYNKYRGTMSRTEE